MGTRNLTVVIHNGKPVVAQYGQWDGGFDGTGLPIKHWITNGISPTFTDNLAKCQYITDSELDVAWASVSSQQSVKTVTFDQSEQFDKRYPHLSRNTGCKILSILSNTILSESIKLIDSYDFALDGLYCEYAYVIDLDKSTLGVYVGFIENNGKNIIKGLWFSSEGSNSSYMPVRLIKEFSFTDLSSIEDGEYVALLESLE